MYVCICKAVTERQIEDAVARGAHCLKDLKHELGVASECGKCASEAKHCLKLALQKIGHHHHRKKG